MLSLCSYSVDRCRGRNLNPKARSFGTFPKIFDTDSDIDPDTDKSIVTLKLGNTSRAAFTALNRDLYHSRQSLSQLGEGGTG